MKLFSYKILVMAVVLCCKSRSTAVLCSQFENNYFTEMCSGSEAGSYLRLIDFVYHSTLGLRVIKKKKKKQKKKKVLWDLDLGECR